ncbi:MAG: response regulator [Anaerolineales bacterium]|nr:response regulator [Anaerolineales bacterium]
MSWSILSISIKYEQDVVIARQRVKQIAGLVGFDTPDQTRIATAVSEIARNAFIHAGGGKAEFRLEGQTSPQVLLIRVQDQGPGIADVPAVLQREPSARPGMGIAAARRLMDQFEIESTPGSGTIVWLKKLLPPRAPLITPERLRQISGQLAEHRPQSPLEEIQQQNRELLRTLEELHQRQEDLIRLNRELEDTNRGVVALYAELDEKADHLRRADEMKSRFLSNMSHEFRTPLNSILALSRLLLDRTDGDLTSEQDKQVRYIRQAGQGLLELVNDLLDLAKIEAGKTVVQPAEFSVADLFSALRGMLRPLLLNEAVTLVFEEPEGLPPLYTDEGKVSQILRNFLSNALKFTERGEVRVSAALAPERGQVIFAVADTGIGIAPENQAHIFEEFTQLEHPLQRRVKGTGLGLPLCRKLATLLGGTVWVESQLGLGSTFFAEIPSHYAEAEQGEGPAAVAEMKAPDPDHLPVLIVEDEAGTRLLYEKFLKGSHFQPIPARTLREAQHMIEKVQPQAIILDILLPDQEAWSWLAKLKSDAHTRRIPVLVVTQVEDPQKGLALGADAYGIKPVERKWLLEQLTRLTQSKPSLLIIDDEVTARYLLTKMLAPIPYLIVEAADGSEGLRRARETQPRAIFLDLILPVLSGFEVLQQLKADPLTRPIPVVVVTSKVLTGEERTYLATCAQATLAKETLSSELVLETVKKIIAAETNGDGHGQTTS